MCSEKAQQIHCSDEGLLLHLETESSTLKGKTVATTRHMSHRWFSGSESPLWDSNLSVILKEKEQYGAKTSEQ